MLSSYQLWASILCVNFGSEKSELMQPHNLFLKWKDPPEIRNIIKANGFFFPSPAESCIWGSRYLSPWWRHLASCRISNIGKWCRTAWAVYTLIKSYERRKIERGEGVQKRRRQSASIRKDPPLFRPSLNPNLSSAAPAEKHLHQEDYGEDGFAVRARLFQLC